MYINVYYRAEGREGYMSTNNNSNIKKNYNKRKKEKKREREKKHGEKWMNNNHIDWTDVLDS